MVKKIPMSFMDSSYTEGKAVDDIVLSKSYLDFPTDMMTHMFHST
jgi:hypothetical protein